MKKISKKILLPIFSIFISSQGWAQNSAHNYNMSLLNNGHEINSSDKRRPVKMTAEMSKHQLKNMRDHLEAIASIVSALAIKDFEKMQKESVRLASSPKMKMMCNNMGKATPGFTEMGLVLHSTADKLVHAAKKKDYDLFVKKLGATLRTCTSCHSTFKQEIVSQEEFHKSMSKIH
ncbi:MAG: hypothetical protein DRQ89_08410 [Epsilonproteobacteria bacterium]|nr:MAG: hypothetical protein DRQ89_08410 [Campylobacterota bacterium]